MQIDLPFVSSMSNSSERWQIVQAIAMMADYMGLQKGRNKRAPAA